MSSKRQYVMPPILLPDEPGQLAAIDWWRELTPDQRLAYICLADKSPPPEEPLAPQYARCRVPVPDEPLQRAHLEQWHELKPEHRLEIILELFAHAP